MTNNYLSPLRKSHLAFFKKKEKRKDDRPVVLQCWPKSCFNWHTASEPCVALPNHPRTRKKTKLQGVLGEYSWSGHTLPVADMVGCLPARILKKKCFLAATVCLSLNQTKLGLYFNSLSPSQRWLTTLITALKLMDTKADCGHRDTILNG